MSGCEQKKDVHPCIVGLRDATVGAVAASTECVVSNPLLAIKYRLQQGQSLAEIRYSVRFLYTGYGLNVASTAPPLAIQFAADRLFKRLLPEHSAAPVASALLAGAVSAYANSPIELVQLHMQDQVQEALQRDRYATISHITMRQTVRDLLAHADGHALLLRGVVPKAFREAGFGVGLLWGNAVARDFIVQRGGSDCMATVGAPAFTGLWVALATHPFDTLSTKMQASCTVKKDRPKLPIVTMRHAFKVIYHDAQLRGLYSGVMPRVLFVATTIGIVDKVRGLLTTYTDRLLERD
jgi:hypothetical protein